MPLLLLSLSDESPDVRAAGVLALGKAAGTDQDDAFAALKVRLADNDLRVRTAACIGLGLQGKEDAIQLLRAIALNDKEGRSLTGRGSGDVMAATRCQALIGLGLLGSRTALPRDVINAITHMAAGADVSGDIQSSAAIALQLQSRQDSIPMMQDILLDDSLDDVARAHIAIGLAKSGARSAVTKLRRTVADSSPLVGYSSVIGLGLLADEDDQETLGLLLKVARDSSDGATRSFAMMALAEIGGADARAHLLKVLSKGKLAEERAFAALAMGVNGALHSDADQTVGSTLLTIYRTERNLEVKCALALSLGLLREPTALTDLRSALQDDGKSDLQGYAAIALGLLRDHPSAAALRGLVAQRRDPTLREKAAVGLALIGDPQGPIALARSAVDSSASKTLLSSSLRGLGLAGDSTTVEFLRDFVENTRRNHADVTRVAAVEALGFLADKDHLPLLSRLQESSNYLAQPEALSQLFAVL
jgi:HEAT repeat protein